MKLTPWINIYSGETSTEVVGAYRALEDTDGTSALNRVAFIEKTPRVRGRPSYLTRTIEELNGSRDWLNWIERPFSGSGPEDSKSRQWCDDMLILLGYELP